MRVREERDRIPRGDSGPKHPLNGPKKAQRHGRLADTQKPHQCPTIPGIYRLLLIFCPKLFQNRPAATRPHQENNPLALGKRTNRGIRRIKVAHVP